MYAKCRWCAGENTVGRGIGRIERNIRRDRRGIGAKYCSLRRDKGVIVVDKGSEDEMRIWVKCFAYASVKFHYCTHIPAWSIKLGFIKIN